MEWERIYLVTGSTAEPAVKITLAEAGLKERSDLQEWVIAHPEILGPGILVVTTEFDRWQAAGGARPLDRLDVLGLDPDGRLVIAELKRDRAPETVDMQAIKYAAFASRFTEETILEQHLRHLRHMSPEKEVGTDAAREAIVSHAGDLDPDLLRRPRIVLVAGSFPASVTATAVWLTEMGLDISLQQVSAHRLAGGQIVVSVTQLYPLAEVEGFMVQPRTDRPDVVRRRRERSAIVRLVEDGTIADGTVLVFRAAEVSGEERAAVEAWLKGDPSGARGSATWRNDRRGPLVWAVDGKGYRPTSLVRQILKAVDLPDRPLRGSAWWFVENDETSEATSLIELAGLASARVFDWSVLHVVLQEVGPGRWTTYGDLATAVGTGAMALGQHVAHCSLCQNAWRILGVDGSPRPGFQWDDDSDQTKSQQEALEAEGLAFPNGRADSAARVPLAELQAVAAEA